MKIKNIFLSLAAATLLLTACGNEDLKLGDSTTAKVAASCPSVEFSTANQTSVEVDPDTPTFSFKVVRKATDAASYAIKVVQGADEFDIPASVDFAAGETETDLKITAKKGLVEGTPYGLELTFDEANLNPYTIGIKDFTAEVTIIKWEPAGRGYWCGNIINTFWSDAVPVVMYVDYEKATTANAVKYRFDSPYGKLETEYDEVDELLNFGNGYKYNSESDLTGNGEKFVISVKKDGVYMPPVQLGMDWGYGEITVGSDGILGEFKASETGGIITFPAGSLSISMANYNDGESYSCSAGPTSFYLSKQDYLASLEE